MERTTLKTAKMIMTTIKFEKFLEIAREQVIDRFNNYINIVDIIKSLQWEKKIGQEIEEKDLDELVEKELDERCSNGHFSRWTNHGYNIWHEYERTKELYLKEK